MGHWWEVQEYAKVRRVIDPAMYGLFYLGWQEQHQ
jgi:hypothetical protein